MAEFKVNPRQVATPQTDLPSTNVYGRLSQALGGISEKVMGVGTAINVEQQALQGAKDRMEGGPRETLAPGITKATEAFNKSFTDMDSSLVISATTTQLSGDLIEAMRPENLAKPNNVENYQQISQARIQGALEETFLSNRPEVALKLSQQAANASIRLAEVQNKHDFDVARAQAAVSNTKLIESIYNNEVNGSVDLASENLSEAISGVEAQVGLGMADEGDLHKVTTLGIQAKINGKVEREYKSLETEAERALYLYALQQGEDGLEITPTQRISAMEHLSGVAAKTTKVESVVGSLGYDRIDQTLNFSPESYPTLESLNAAIAESAQNGFPLKMAQQIDLQNQWLKAYQKANAESLDYVRVKNMINTADAANLTAKELDNYYFNEVQIQQEEINKLLQSNAPDKEKLLNTAATWQIETAVAAQSKYSAIPAFTKKLTTKLYEGTVQEKIEAAESYNHLQTKNPAALRDLNATDKALMQDILNRLRNTSVAPEQIMEESFKDIVEVPEAVREAREKSLAKFKKDKPKFVDELTKSIFGSDFKGMLDTNSLLMKTAIENEFDTYYRTKGSDKLAAQLTEKSMGFKAGPSKFGQPNGLPMWNPVEKLPFYGFGKTVENQFTRNLQEIVRLSEKNPDKSTIPIRWSKKMGDAPKAWSENDKMYGDYARNGWWLNIGGVDRQVYLVSPSLNQSSGLGTNEPIYSIYYNRDGIPQQLTTLGPTTMQFRSPDKDVPKVYESLQNETADASLTRAASDAFRMHTKDTLPTLSLYAPQLEMQKIANKKELKKYIESFKKEKPGQIKNEKLRRLEAKLEKEAEGSLDE